MIKNGQELDKINKKSYKKSHKKSWTLIMMETV